MAISSLWCWSVSMDVCIFSDLCFSLGRMAESCCAVTPASMPTIPTACLHRCLRCLTESGPASGVPVSLSLAVYRKFCFGGVVYLELVFLLL